MVMLFFPYFFFSVLSIVMTIGLVWPTTLFAAVGDARANNHVTTEINVSGEGKVRTEARAEANGEKVEAIIEEDTVANGQGQSVHRVSESDEGKAEVWVETDIHTNTDTKDDAFDESSGSVSDAQGRQDQPETQETFSLSGENTDGFMLSFLHFIKKTMQGIASLFS
jgi:hypothetical protein